MSQPQLETIVLLLIGVLTLTALAHRLLIPYPILLVLGGIALSVVPGLPAIALDPDVVFLVFLPPVLWAAAYFTSLNDFKANARPIFLLAFGLVLATTGAVAVTARMVFPEMSWAVAFTLGAVVSPPDAVAATAIMRQLGIPGRIVTVLEGESLVNDATALVLYRVAVAAVVTGAFSWSDAVIQFFVAAIVGVGIGLLIGYLGARATRLTDGVASDILLTLLSPYVAWVLAERAHASAVLACVAGGLMMRRHFSIHVAAETRLQGRAVWDLLVFVLTGLIFILIGLQVGPLRDVLSQARWQQIASAALAISVVTIVTRLVWVPIATWLPRAISARTRHKDPMPPRSWIFIVAWVGMRGVVSLASALALPLTTQGGAPLPYRAEIIVITVAVIIVTLVAQGLSLAPLVRMLGLHRDETLETHRRTAREHAARAALKKLDNLEAQEIFREHVDHVRGLYGETLQRLLPANPEQERVRRDVRLQALEAERAAIIDLRDRGVISDEIMIEIEQDLDTQAAQLTRQEGVAAH